MKNRLGSWVREQRVARGLTLGRLAAEVGYRNIGKGTNRLHQLETEGEFHPDLLLKVIAALDLDTRTLRRLLAEDREAMLSAWNAWADEPVPPLLVVRAIPGFYVERALPEGVVKLRAAEAIASAYAARRGLRVCLVFNRRLSVFFETDGERRFRSIARPEALNQPATFLGGSKSAISFRVDDPTSPNTRDDQ